MDRKKRYYMYAILFIVGFIGISLWSTWIITHPPKIIIDSTAARNLLPLVDVQIEADDGVVLSGWLIEPSEKIDKAIIIYHGYPVEKADMLRLAKALSDDFALLLMDMRYFGESGGSYTTFGVKERSDAERAVDFLESRGYTRIGIFGFSLGGTVGLLAAAEDKRINAVASYAAFSDIRKLGRETYSNLWILKYPLVELMLLWTKIAFDMDVASISPIAVAPKITVPVFLIHTQADDQISFSHAEAIEAALADNDKLEVYFPERGLHGELPYDFDDRLKDFFNRSL